MRVTERAQHAVHHAKGEAGRLGHDRVGTEHLLLGLLRDEECLAVVTLGELGIPPETVRRQVEERVGRGQGEQGMGFHLPMTKPALLVLGLGGREAMDLDHDRLGTEHLLLGLAREGEGVAAQVLQQLGAGLLELREAVAARYAAGVDPEPFPPDRGPPPWEPPPSARLRRVVPLQQEHPLPSGDHMVLISLEVWSDWFDLRYAVVYATPEPEGELPRPSVIGGCEVSDRAGTAYTSPTSSSPSFGMVRVTQRTFVPSPPAGTEFLELRLGAPSTRPGEAPPLIVATVDLR
ncbi:MAG TPA: Clp protease N-terminal domain-containing protein [Actinomycetota bacterium]|nr:Clp protease N-terminal domain-containing protein [Actinomycetota bacterium]